MVVYRARIFTPTGDPFATEDPPYHHFADGFLRIDEGGSIDSTGPWSAFELRTDDDLIDLGSDALITPGFVDAHLHGPQLEMIGSYGGHLLEWLNRYTFPTEAEFVNDDHARNVAEGLFDELLRNGTVSALIFSTTHASATEIFFQEAERRGIRAIIGKTMMDQNAPTALLESADDSYAQSRALIEKWHGRGLLRYAVSPRFAPTSSRRLLELAGRLKAEFPDVYIHTHVSENQSEIFWVKQLFPDIDNYVGVYAHFGLLDRRSVFAHGVHLTEDELRILAESETRICHCPNSNLFLGSGLFPLKDLLRAGVIVGLGSDIGAGTTPSMFNAMADAYKVQQVQGVSLSPFHLWYLATLGGARALSFDDVSGSLEPGKEADFLVLDLKATPLLSRRTARAETIEEILAGLMFLGDDRVVRQTFVRGREVATRDALRT